jgi:hypothetical protein
MTSGPHVPFAWQVLLEVVVPSHATWPGVQMAPHSFAITAPFCQAVPVELHVCGIVELQRICPGVQRAPQVPATIGSLTHAPAPLQLCGTVAEHCMVPGTHIPVQLPAAHVFVHAVGAPHLPVPSQTWVVLPTHSFEAVLHTPQTPAPLQNGVAFAQLVAGAHCPLGVQLCVEDPSAHCMLPGTQTPHCPAPLQSGVSAGHVTATPHVKSVPQVSTPLPEHFVPPGAHSPVHEPEVQR